MPLDFDELTPPAFALAAHLPIFHDERPRTKV